MGFPARLAYWAFTAPITFALGSFVAAYTAACVRGRGPAWRTPLLVATSTALAVGPAVLLINWVALGLTPDTPAHTLGLLASVFVTAALVALALYYLTHHEAKAPSGPPPLLARLPFEKRGALVSLSVQDHYVEIVTTKGQELILMRLSDAIRETGQDMGLQVHRSHWVAFGHIASVTRTGDKARITLKDGRDIPASRSYIPTLKDAGLLPR